MDIFKRCQTINDLIISDKTDEARNELIKLLDCCKKPYDELINHLIRQLGLYPYLDIETSSWQEKFVYEAFKVDIGNKKLVTLHREQSSVLKDLLGGKDLTLIAPTSFGKSFIIDAFITLSKPKNIAIIVPTIALTDETRRRLNGKFSNQYKIITTSDIELDEQNIFIFPQERALHYVDKIEQLDMLVIDEFYKASVDFDKDRSKTLLNAIVKLGSKSKQKYFLAPNISKIKPNPFTNEMTTKNINFNTVFLNIHKSYESIAQDSNKKKSKLLEVLNNTYDKTLIYAGTYSEITKLSNIIKDKLLIVNNDVLNDFSQWIAKNYDPNWDLVDLVKKGTGVHNGRLHRSLSQIQIKLFSEHDGLKNIISTSSIIEGVNTSAKNVIFWGKRNGRSNLKYFGYKNLIGRGGRMFKHFIGEIYLFERPPEDKEVQLSLEMPKELIDENSIEVAGNLKQRKIVVDFYNEMSTKLGFDSYKKLRKQGFFEENSWDVVRKIIDNMQQNHKEWNGLGYLNSGNPEEWGSLLHKIKRLCKVSGHQTKLVDFTKTASQSWHKTIPELLNGGKVEDFFELEKIMSFNLSNAINCVNTLQQEVLDLGGVDISPFATKLSYAFLPKNVYLLEEYGLPRMISKKIQASGLVNIENNDRDLHSIIDNFNNLTYEKIINEVENLDNFDKYILEYFFEGIKKIGVLAS